MTPPTDTPLLSIVIPTRNRVQYAASVVRSILAIPDSRFELVIQDNTDSTELESHIRASITDSRLCYRYTASRLSMIDNFNAALDLARGEYVCVIGDDDGVNPEIVDAAAWLLAEHIDCLAMTVRAGYLWPGVSKPQSVFGTKLPGSLTIASFRGAIEVPDINGELACLMQNGGVYYLDFKLPKLYHGLVRRRCLDAIREKTGAFLGGLSPDSYAAVAIACVAGRVRITDYPLTVAGACPGSGSAYRREGGFKKPLEESFVWRDRGPYHWSDLVPRVHSAETVWVDSEIAALHAMGRHDLVGRLSLPRLAAYCIAANRHLSFPVLRGLLRGLRFQGRSRIAGGLALIWNLFSGPGVRLWCRLWRRLLVVIGKRNVHAVHGLVDMCSVSAALVSYLKTNRRSFASCIANRTD